MDKVVVAFPEQPMQPPNQQGVHVSPDEHPFYLNTFFVDSVDEVIQRLILLYKKDKGDLVFGLVQAR